ncbi:aldo/keto reductase [Embleya sp. NPDC001921]
MRDAHPRIVLGLHRSRHRRPLIQTALDLGIDAIDTAYNYADFTSHTRLANTVRDLLPRLTVSTKVGFFPTSGHAEHSLDPHRLRGAIEQTCRDLGMPPDTVFLHNPERSLTRLASPHARRSLTAACLVLEEAAAAGLCRTWGIASWDPRALPAASSADMPVPRALMVRAGLLAGVQVLDAADTLAARWDLTPASVRGMSPFGGSMTDPVWGGVDPRIFLAAPEKASRVQAALRVAHHLPRVDTVAVGSDDPEHLSELVQALNHEIDTGKVARYRALLGERAARQRAV